MVLLISPEQIELESCACAQIEALEEGNRWFYLDDAGDLSERGRNPANMISDGGGLFALFSQIGAMVLLISLEGIKLKSCACAQIEALEEGNRWLYLDNAGHPSERRKNAANLISVSSGRFCCF